VYIHTIRVSNQYILEVEGIKIEWRNGAWNGTGSLWYRCRAWIVL
jgi:hypothetical protein